ncbi:MAG: ABC transporter permease [Lachnospiraceae bacterium]|nr:ABC transporter permease [Lachnospiraceae bacterium]
MKNYKGLIYPYIVWIAIMIVVPMLMIFAFAFIQDDGSSVSFTFDNFKRFFSDETFPNVLKRSLGIALSTTLVCILFGYPAAYIMSKAEGKKKSLLVLLMTMPMWINMLVRTYALMGILADNGLLNSILSFLGIPMVQIMYTDSAVMLGMVYDFLPFMVLQIHGSLEKMDKSLLEAAADLGAGKGKTFLKVVLPLSIPGVLSGITLVFLPAVSSYFIPNILGGGGYTLVGNLIQQYSLTTERDFASAISLIMAVIIMLSMALTKKLEKFSGTEGSED